jgi:hypothetical protein
VERRADAGGEKVEIVWSDPAFVMPLEVEVGGERRRLEMENGRGSFLVAAGTVVEVDPDGWVLAEPASGR